MRNARSRLSTYTPDDLEERCSRDVSIRDTVLKPCYSDGVARLLHQAPEAQPLYVAHRIKMRSGACAASREDVDAGKGGGVAGGQAPGRLVKLRPS